MGIEGDTIDYAALIEGALRDVICGLLRSVAKVGLPGGHHFYLSFDTSHPEVELSAGLRQQYPDEMTIVLQNQFRDLDVDDEGLSVTLTFSGVPERLSIPFSALTAFADPEAEFGLRFQRLEEELRSAGGGAAAQTTDAEETADSEDAVDSNDGEAMPAAASQGQVVRLDDFRKE